MRITRASDKRFVLLYGELRRVSRESRSLNSKFVLYNARVQLSSFDRSFVFTSSEERGER